LIPCVASWDIPPPSIVNPLTQATRVLLTKARDLAFKLGLFNMIQSSASRHSLGEVPLELDRP
jgi:hypothetical protein